MQISNTGLNLIKQFESCRLTAYQDIRGIWTVGWGTTGPDIIEGLIWTQDEADARLTDKIQSVGININAYVKVNLTQGQFDALSSFAYNVGCGALAGSNLLRLLNAGNSSGASNEFPKWDHANGQVIAGLLRRRIAEQTLFNS